MQVRHRLDTAQVHSVPFGQVTVALQVPVLRGLDLGAVAVDVPGEIELVAQREQLLLELGAATVRLEEGQNDQAGPVHPQVVHGGIAVLAR